MLSYGIWTCRMRKRRQILYQICGIFLGISCMLSACHEKEETFTSVAAAEADAGDKKNEAESKAAEEKPDKEKADPGCEEKEGSIWVYVCGEVASPGVYELQEGDRITLAILADALSAAECSYRLNIFAKRPCIFTSHVIDTCRCITSQKLRNYINCIVNIKIIPQLCTCTKLHYTAFFEGAHAAFHK